MSLELVDTHVHLYAKEFSDDTGEVIKRAQAAGVLAFCLPNIDVESIGPMQLLKEKYPELIYQMMGLHPGSVKENFKHQLKLIGEELFRGQYIAVGEIGLDYYWTEDYKLQQKQAFEEQLNWASQLNLPVVIHNRDAFDDAYSLAKKAAAKGVKGIFHCFTGTLEQARKVIEIGFMLGIGGVLTYKKASLDEVIAKIDIGHIVLETDAPYLSPVPYRGKRNESAYLKEVADKLSRIYGMTLEEIGEQTTLNAGKIFNQAAYFK